MKVNLKIKSAGLFVILMSICYIASPGAAMALDSVARDFNSRPDPAVESLAKMRDISLEQAAERIARSDRAAKLNDEFIEQNDRGFGGMWIDRNTDRVNIGILRTELESSMSRQINNYQLTGVVNFVTVQYAYSDLVQTRNFIFDSLRNLDFKGSDGYNIKIVPSKNQVVLSIPKTDESMGVSELGFITKIKDSYGDMIKIERHGSNMELASCGILTCGSPLRGAVKILGGAASNTQPLWACTAGFGVRGNSGTKYILTAGHCQDDDGDYWRTKNASYSTDVLMGDVHRNIYYETSGSQNNPRIDAMIIKLSDLPGTWSAVGKVYVRAGFGLSPWTGPSTNEEYDITDYATSSSLEGERVCMSGAVSATYEGGSCGGVIGVLGGTLLVSGYYLDGIVEAELCGRHGDSGAPVFREGKALGILTAIPAQNDALQCGWFGGPGKVYYTGFQPIRNAFNQTINIY